MLFFTKDQKVHSPRMSRIWSDLEDPTPLPGFLPHPRRSLEAALSVAPQTASWWPTEGWWNGPMDPAVLSSWFSVVILFVSWMKTQMKNAMNIVVPMLMASVVFLILVYSISIGQQLTTKSSSGYHGSLLKPRHDQNHVEQLKANWYTMHLGEFLDRKITWTCR